MAEKSTEQHTIAVKGDDGIASPKVPDSELMQGLVHVMLQEEKREREDLVRNLFESIGSLKARNSKRPSSAETFSSQNPSRASVSITPAQRAFKRTTLGDQAALLSAFRPKER
ncbi:MAG: hypothetical protein HQL45_05310 [Alphaproteobacteria bacterium]|nr:hypothetical protein [Alphaproteobacteria bacterium]